MLWDRRTQFNPLIRLRRWFELENPRFDVPDLAVADGAPQPRTAGPDPLVDAIEARAARLRRCQPGAGRLLLWIVSGRVVEVVEVDDPEIAERIEDRVNRWRFDREWTAEVEIDL